MKKPKIKKRKKCWLVYTDKKHVVKCFSYAGALLWFNALMK